MREGLGTQRNLVQKNSSSMAFLVFLSFLSKGVVRKHREVKRKRKKPSKYLLF